MDCLDLRSGDFGKDWCGSINGTIGLGLWRCEMARSLWTRASNCKNKHIIITKAFLSAYRVADL